MALMMLKHRKKKILSRMMISNVAYFGGKRPVIAWMAGSGFCPYYICAAAL